MHPARVTVLMTTYNGASTIAASIDSILAQHFQDFELLVVDDGSTDETPTILARITDPRLRSIRTTRNSGIVAARNYGFAAARTPYIAALDHDDLSDPERLMRQVAFLDANPHVVLLGTEIRIAQDGKLTAPHHPSVGDPLALRWLLLIDNPLTWSSVMFRADAIHRIGQFLRPDYELADDFDLYHRLLTVGEIARLDDVLTTYSYHATNTSYAHAAPLNANAASVLRTAYTPWLGEDAAVAAELVIKHLSDRQPIRDPATLDRLGLTLERLLQGFCQTYNLPPPDRQRIATLAGEAWWRTVRSAVRSGTPSMIGRYRARRLLSSSFRPTPIDAAFSVAIGTIRAYSAP
jgi:hypothetical protein